MTEMLSARVRLDARRRPTLPRELLEAAGVGSDEEWVARVEGPGRIVLESTATVLATLQAAVAASRTTHQAPSAGEDSELGSAHGGEASRSLVEELVAQRATDAATEDQRAPNLDDGAPQLTSTAVARPAPRENP